MLPEIEEKNKLSYIEEQNWHSKLLLQLRSKHSCGLSIQARNSRSISAKWSIIKLLTSYKYNKEKI